MSILQIGSDYDEAWGEEAWTDEAWAAGSDDAVAGLRLVQSDRYADATDSD